MHSVLRWLRGRTAALVNLYLRHPATFVIAGGVWWIAYVVALELVLGKGVGESLDAALRVTFAIVSPHEASIGAWQTSHPNAPIPLFVSAVGWMGWTVIISFTFLIPALVASMIERLPSLASSLATLITPQLWKFVGPYSTALRDQTRLMLIEVDGSDPESTTLLANAQKNALVTIATFVRQWYLDDESDQLHANCSFMRLIAGAEHPDPNAAVLYSKGKAAEHDRLLELVGWAYDLAEVPQSLLLAVDKEHPKPGAPNAVRTKESDGISDTRNAGEWRRRGVSGAELDETLQYFRGVPFRSFMSIPVRDAEGEVIGVISIQVDRPRKFVPGNDETMQLVALIEPICYFFAWIERSRGR